MLADPERPYPFRYQAGAVLLPDVARWEAHGVWWSCPLYPGRAAALRPCALHLYDRAVSATARGARHPWVDRQHRLHARRAAAYGRERGHALRARLQRQWHRDDDLSWLSDRSQDRPGD